MLAAPAADATRTRLIEAAGEVFAEQGFQAATIREICSRAGANVAAVNYYFRDKMGLYREALRETLPEAERVQLIEAVRAAAPEEALRMLTLAMLRRMIGGDGPVYRRFRIVAHELSQPSPALKHVVEEVIGPNYALWRETIGRILGLPPGHKTTRLCAHSAVAQVVHYAHARPVIELLWPDLAMSPAGIDRIASHIATFSLHAIQGIAHDRKSPGKSK